MAMPNVGDKAPEFSLPITRDQKVGLSDFVGKKKRGAGVLSVGLHRWLKTGAYQLRSRSQELRSERRSGPERKRRFSFFTQGLCRTNGWNRLSHAFRFLPPRFGLFHV